MRIDFFSDDFLTTDVEIANSATIWDSMDDGDSYPVATLFLINGEWRIEWIDGMFSSFSSVDFEKKTYDDPNDAVAEMTAEMEKV